MLLLIFLISFFVSKGESGELLIVKSPPSIKFQEDTPVDQHLVPEICSAAMGFTTQRESSWNGMTISDPFNFAEVVVVVYVDGISSLGKYENLLKYSLNNNEEECVTWKKIRNRILDRYPMENNTVVRLDLSIGDQLGDVDTKHLNVNKEEDAAFLKEIHNLKKHSHSIKKSDGVPDLIWFNLKSLHELSDVRGPHDVSTMEAKEKVHESLLKLSKAYDSAYHDQAFVIAVVSDASHTRRARSVPDEKGETINVTSALMDNIYDPDFPVIFNIILWFTVALIFSLLAVSVFIASMDPGRDSIIYRMTSNRMKKDS